MTRSNRAKLQVVVGRVLESYMSSGPFQCYLTLIPHLFSDICAYPESINVLPGVSGDVRTPDKLINGINNDPGGAHSWLAPIIPESLNRIYIVLDYPATVSRVILWNYSKMPSRGVKEFAVSRCSNKLLVNLGFRF